MLRPRNDEGIVSSRLTEGGQGGLLRSLRFVHGSILWPPIACRVQCYDGHALEWCYQVHWCPPMSSKADPMHRKCTSALILLPLRSISALLFITG